MSVIRAAASGAFWSIGIGVGVRVVGLVGTLAITHYLTPDVLGEVAAATILAMTASWLSHWGFNQYVIVKGADTSDGVFHATVLHLALGFVAIAIVLGLADRFTSFLNAPNLGEYLPGMALVVLIKRFGSIPDKLLVRDMRFKYIALASGAGELAYISLAVTLVVTTDLGGQAIVIANIVQAAFVTTVVIRGAGFARWLAPKPWRWERAREVLRFGAPIGMESVLFEAGRQWDKLMFSRLFGPHTTGMYSLSYNLSDLPATYIGEHVATVLVPTLVNIEPSRRNEVFAQACGLLAFVVMPMAVGLACVAETLVKVLLSPEWQGVADFLGVLAAIAVFRPLTAAVSSLLMAMERTWPLLGFEMLKMAVMFGGIAMLSPFGAVVAASALPLGLAAQFAAGLVVLARQGFPVGALFAQLRGPALAAVAIAAVVLPLREAFEGTSVPMALRLATEIVAGALAYVAAALVFARATIGRFANAVREQLRRRRRGAAASG
ncbi:MAG: oligosaccharide flippase family protein [Betaproteobacteria bacterium]|nr:oligosaccharide flippase family protein [Betaproteobacteria bacterium]